MIGKLFLQDLRSTWKPLLTGVGIALLIAAVSVTLAAIRVPLLGELGLVVGLLAVGSITPLVLVLLVVNYWRTMYGREGYFTMSIPVRGRVLFAAKVIYGLVASVIALGITALALIGTSAAFGLRQGLGAFEVLNQVFSAVDPSMVWFLIGALVLQLGFSVVTGAAMMSIGAEARFSHLGFGAPVIGTVILYFVMQVLGLAATLFIPFGLKFEGAEMGGLVAQGMFDDFVVAISDPSGQAQPSVIGLGMVFVAVAVAALLAWWGARSVDRHTSLR